MNYEMFVQSVCMAFLMFQGAVLGVVGLWLVGRKDKSNEYELFCNIWDTQWRIKRIEERLGLRQLTEKLDEKPAETC